VIHDLATTDHALVDAPKPRRRCVACGRAVPPSGRHSCTKPAPRVVGGDGVEHRCVRCGEPAGTAMRAALLLYQMSDGSEDWWHRRCAAGLPDLRVEALPLLSRVSVDAPEARAARVAAWEARARTDRKAWWRRKVKAG
jgi:ribosomal protein S14